MLNFLFFTIIYLLEYLRGSNIIYIIIEYART